MRPKERDPAYLWDMREAARDVLRFIEGADFERFASDKMLRYAVERQVTVIGEAARRVSQAFKNQHPEIPWLRPHQRTSLLSQLSAQAIHCPRYPDDSPAVQYRCIA
jgi:uncharacterized protein with HEPN domain